MEAAPSLQKRMGLPEGWAQTVLASRGKGKGAAPSRKPTKAKSCYGCGAPGHLGRACPKLRDPYPARPPPPMLCQPTPPCPPHYLVNYQLPYGPPPSPYAYGAAEQAYPHDLGGLPRTMVFNFH